MFSKLQELQHLEQPSEGWVKRQDPKGVQQKPPPVFGPPGSDGSREIPGDGDLIVSNISAAKDGANPPYPPYDPSTRVAHDNDDFRQLNLSRSIFPFVGVHFAFTRDKYGRHYFLVWDVGSRR